MNVPEDDTSAAFFKFPHTPHLAWLGPGSPRDDKVLSPTDARAILKGGEVTVEEKIDGANIGLSLDATGALRAQSRGKYIAPGGHAQYEPLWPWLDARRVALEVALGPRLMLFGEWCFALHSVRYDRLPDWFLGFDVYDRAAGQFWSVERRDPWMEAQGLAVVPPVTRGQLTTREIVSLLGRSRVCDGPAEGLYVRRDYGPWLVARAKLVRPEFTQAIEKHWSKRAIIRNALAADLAGVKLALTKEES